jgi:hypothetical protein
MRQRLLSKRNADSTTVDYNCSITQRNILTPERISQVPEREYHKDTCKREAGYFFVAHPVYSVLRKILIQNICTDRFISNLM